MRYIFIITLTSILIASSFTVYAQEENNDVNVNKLNKVKQFNVATDSALEGRKISKEKREELRAERRKSIIKRVVARLEKMIRRAKKRLRRLDNIWDRVQSRIDKFESAGKEVDEIQDLILDVEVKRQTAEDTINEAATKLSDFDIENSDKKTIRDFIKGLRKDVKEALKDYRKSIHAVILSLKDIRKEAKITISPNSVGETSEIE